MIPRSLMDGDRRALPASEVGVIVVGSGVAGLSTALELPAGLPVLLVTKARVASSATRYAQGGIAAVLGADDSPGDHWADTMTAGAGLCDPEAVRVLVAEGPAAVRRLQRLGTSFDLEGGRLALTLEGGHSRRRIVHAGGDATGAEVERALVAAVRDAPNVAIAERTFLVDLVTDGGAVTGAVVWSEGDGPRLVRAGAVVLASGGAGQLYASTTNPALSTGDGIAAALRAGATLADLEFVQFHPTALHLETDPRQLISEAMRGEGAVLRDGRGIQVMAGVHPLGDLAPRDVVTRGMAARMTELGVDHLFLDATGVLPARLERRFPTILARCRAAGVEPTRDWIPVSPAAHYLMGGVLTDLNGRSNLPGLYAVGEAACTGVHGANRLASNSLLEGLVFASRIARAIAEGPADGWSGPGAPAPGSPGSPSEPESPRGPGSPGKPSEPGRTDGPVPGPRAARPRPAGGGDGRLAALRGQLRELMTTRAGVLRSHDGLAGAAAGIAGLSARLERVAAAGGRERWEVANLLQIGAALVRLAANREESRGAHSRSDHPDPVEAWRLRQVLTRRLDGGLDQGTLPVPEPEEARR